MTVSDQSWPGSYLIGLGLGLATPLQTVPTTDYLQAAVIHLRRHLPFLCQILFVAISIEWQPDEASVSAHSPTATKPPSPTQPTAQTYDQHIYPPSKHSSPYSSPYCILLHSNMHPRSNQTLRFGPSLRACAIPSASTLSRRVMSRVKAAAAKG